MSIAGFDESAAQTGAGTPAPRTLPASWAPVGPWLRIAGGLTRLLAALLAFAAYWPWARYRGVIAFRRELRRAGLPPDAVARLAANYASVGNPRHLLALVSARRPTRPRRRGASSGTGRTP